MIEKNAWKRGLTPLDKGERLNRFRTPRLVDSESVEELAEEGNAFEANALYGVENARDPDVAEVITHEIPEDDVPGEYLDNDEHLA